MGGISGYYHGEAATVVDRSWVASDKRLFHAVRLADNPHRTHTHGYGSDIAIDPQVNVGDRVVYVRLDAYCGLWLREADAQYPGLQSALDRVLARTPTLRDWDCDVNPPNADAKIAARAQRLSALSRETGIPARTIAANASLFPDDDQEPRAKAATFFLSYSSRNVLMARQLSEDLLATADVDVWFDLRTSGEAPDHDARISSWLRDAVGGSQGFVLLLTRASAASEWVAREIRWACEEARKRPGFRLIVLKLEDVPVPKAVDSSAAIIDGDQLWWDAGLAEELFAAVYNRQGRQAWLDDQRVAGVDPLDDREDVVFSYKDYESDAGVANDLRCWEENDGFHWELSYRRGNETLKVRHAGMECAVDLRISAGDRIAFFVCHRFPTVRALSGVPVWMRSEDLEVPPAEIISRYMQQVPEDQSRRTWPRRPGSPPLTL